ncbi:MAG TPA: hypothetical protein IAA99_05660 [Candidatus Avibacteroides faecavium]|nr:hypothetical protein [Candidatus Avibacteroides faecavium]
MKILTLPAFILPLLFVSCTSKEDYIEDFHLFIDEVKADSPAFNDEQWDEADVRFDELSEEDFADFKDELTDDELHDIDQMTAIYLGLKAKKEAEERLQR